MKAQRTQIDSGDAEQPTKLRRVLNDLLLDLYARLEALEAAKGIYVFDVTFDTGAALAPTSPPFAPANGGVRISCPFTPTGLFLLQLQQTAPSGQPISVLASDVKWHFAGPEGTIIIDFVTGLNVSSSYKMRVGVTRA